MRITLIIPSYRRISVNVFPLEYSTLGQELRLTVAKEGKKKSLLKQAILENCFEENPGNHNVVS